MSAQMPLYSNISVSSYPSNGVRTPWDTVRTQRLRLGPTVAQSQALRRTVPSWPTTPSMSERKIARGTLATSQPSCPTTPSISERKIATGTPMTSQPAMRISSNASTGAKYSSMPSVSTGIAMNRTSPAAAKVLSGGVNLGAPSSKTLPATNPSGRAAPSRPVLRTGTTPRVDRFAAKGAQAEANRAAQQTGMAPPHTDKADQSAQRNDRALEPPEIEPPISDEAKMMPEIPPPFPAPAQAAATSQVQASKIVDKMEKVLNADAKANMMPAIPLPVPAPEQPTATSQVQASTVVVQMEAALNADETAPNSSDAERKIKLAQGLREAADNCMDALEGSDDALRQRQIQKAIMQAANGLSKAPSVVKDADEKPPVETQQVVAGPVPISQSIITSSYTTTKASPFSQPKSLRPKSKLLGKLFGRTFKCFDDEAGA